MLNIKVFKISFIYLVLFLILINFVSALDVGKIVFQSYRSGTADVWVINEDGTKLKQLTNSTDDEMMPTWSPDGSRIAYIHKTGTTYKLYIMNNDSTGKTLIYTSPYANEWMSPAKWSSDGIKLVFSNSIAYNNAHIFTINSDGTNATDLTPGTALNREPSWSTNGAQIVYEHKQGAASYTYEIYTMNSDGTNQTRITFGAGSESTTKYQPDWNPNSTTILYTSGHNIATMSTNGSNINFLTGDAVYGTKQYGHPSWSPDSSKIVFDLYQTDGNDYDVWKMNNDGTGITRLTINASTDNRPDWIVLTLTDTDSDGYANVDDNCPSLNNSNQLDADYDDYGAVCDCNDANPYINPGISEILCDGVDNDCSGSANNGTDIDIDGYKLEGGLCGAIDCNDNNASINPNVAELICDGIDNDCSGADDAGTDSDGDTYKTNGGLCGVIDCNDANSSINPGTAEILCDGIDNDCSGSDDTGTDDDGDSFNINGGLCGDVDCDDSDDAIYPGAIEILCDSIDDDCSGADNTGTDSDGDSYKTDGGLCGTVDCNDNNASINPNATEILCDSIDDDCSGADNTGTDSDGDSYKINGGLCGVIDCNDANSSINPNATEILCDGIDNDCSGADSVGTDADGDSYKTDGGLCGIIDCNDGNSSINPGAAPETSCSDGNDNDCDSNIDAADSDCDTDGDGVINDEDKLAGNASSVDAGNLTNPLNISINGSTDLTQAFNKSLNITFMDGDEKLLEFEFDFSSSILNLSNISIAKQDANATAGSIVVRGINLPAGQTKTVYIDKVQADVVVCIKDAVIASVSEIQSTCDGADETRISCPASGNPNIRNGYTCTNLVTRFKIEGLTHSGVLQIPCTDNDGDGYGDGCAKGSDCDDGDASKTTDCSGSSSGGSGKTGGSNPSCIEDWSCTNWQPVICPSTKTQTRICNDSNRCSTTENKPLVSRDCEYKAAKEITEEETEEVAESTGMSTVTGAVVAGGVGKNSKIVVGVIASILVLGTISYFFIKKKYY